MKFTLSLLAALLGVVSASSHNGSANGTATTPVSGGGGGGGGGGAGATTPAATTETAAINTTGAASFKTNIAATVTLDGNLTSSDVTSATSGHSASTPYTPGTCGSDGLGVTCKFLKIVQSAAVTMSGDATASVYGIGTATGRRRSLSDKDEARRLSDTAFTFKTLQVYATDDAARTVFSDEASFATAIGTAATTLGTLTVASVTATMDGDLTTTTGTTETETEAGAALGTGTGSTSSAFKMGASALAVVFSVVSLF